MVVEGDSEIILEICIEPASGSYAVVAQQIIGREHGKTIRHGASAAVRDDDIVATRGHLVGGPVVGITPNATGDGGPRERGGAGGIDAQGQQEQGGEADDETSPGVLAGNANFQGTSVHIFFFCSESRFGGNYCVGRIKLAQNSCLPPPPRMLSKSDAINITESNDYVN